MGRDQPLTTCPPAAGPVWLLSDFLYLPQHRPQARQVLGVPVPTPTHTLAPSSLASSHHPQSRAQTRTPSGHSRPRGQSPVPCRSLPGPTRGHVMGSPEGYSWEPDGRGTPQGPALAPRLPTGQGSLNIGPAEPMGDRPRPIPSEDSSTQLVGLLL